MTTQTLVRKVQAERAEIAKREQVERERKAAEERKRAEDAEAERITRMVEQYVGCRDEVKRRERDLAAIDKEIAALGSDMPALKSRWDAFNNSRAAHLWRQELKQVPTPGVQQPNRIPPGFTESDMKRLDAYATLQRQRVPADTLLTNVRTHIRKLEADEPALRVISEGAK